MSPKTFATGGGSSGGSGTPSNPDTSVQYNNGGSFGGDAAFLFNDVTKLVEFLTSAGISFDGPAAPIIITGEDTGGGETLLQLENSVDDYIPIRLVNYSELYTPNELLILAGNIGVPSPYLYFNPAEPAIAFHSSDGVQLWNFSFDGRITQGRTVAALAAAAATVAKELFSFYNAIGGSPTTSFFTNDWNEMNVGAGGAAVLGITTNRVDNTFVNGSGSADNSFATYHSTIEANIGTGFAQSIAPTGQFFISDWQLYGPIAVQPKVLQGLMAVMMNHYNGSPSGAESNGLLFITKKGIGDGNATHKAADTFPIDSAIQIRGYSTASAVDGVGWTKGIQIGGSGSPWGESKSIIGTGIHIRDYTTHGIKIDNPIGTPTASIEVDGIIKAGRFTTQADNADILDPLYTTGRLTLVTGNAIPTTDQTAKGTLYYTSVSNDGTITAAGFSIVINDGTNLQLYDSAEISLALTLTSGKNYDVFIYNNAGTITLELSAAWTNDTTRADALAAANGQIVKSGTTTRRWVGTIRASGSNVTEDSAGGSTTQVGGKRFVWNAYNQVPHQLAVIDTTDTWSYTTVTIRQANGASGNKVEYVTGLISTVVEAVVTSTVFLIANSARAAYTAVGLDSTTTFIGQWSAGYSNAAVTGGNFPVGGRYRNAPGLGYHYLSWNESGADGTCSFHGDSGGADQSGLQAVLLG